MPAPLSLSLDLELRLLTFSPMSLSFPAMGHFKCWSEALQSLETPLPRPLPSRDREGAVFKSLIRFVPTLEAVRLSETYAAQTSAVRALTHYINLTLS